jgi:hypothetical protein
MAKHPVPAVSTRASMISAIGEIRRGTDIYDLSRHLGHASV